MEFNRAPVAEVVIGAQFEEEVFSNQCIYDYYQKIKSLFPIIKENPILPSIIEKEEGANEIKLLQGFNSRRFFINPTDTKLIQLQPDRLMFNWRKTSDEDEYPHFSVVLKEFLNVFNQLRNYCDHESKLNQLEVTYVDHIFLEDFNKIDYNPVDILNIFNFKTNIKVKRLEQQTLFPVEELNGNLNLTIRSATRKTDNKKLLYVESTCRGGRGNYTIEKWCDLAHKKLLDLFNEIITEKAKNIWGIIP